MRFGYGGGTDVVIPVRLDDGEDLELSIRGRIDRVAFDPGGHAMAVTDYKTGGSSRYSALTDDVVDKGTSLQVPLYMAAARNLFPEVEPSLLFGFYWFVFEPGADSMIAPKGRVSWEEVEARLREVIGVIVQGIRNGEFPARPGVREFMTGTWANCGYCPYDAACDSGRAATWGNKLGSVPQRYVAMVEPDAIERLIE